MKGEIKRVLEEITPGEWVYAGSHGFIGVVEDGFKITGFICRTVSSHGYASTTPADRELIIKSPEWLHWQNERIEQLEKALEMAMPIVEHNSPTLAKMIRHDLGKEG